MKRTGRKCVVRNEIIGAGDSGYPGLVPQIEGLLRDASPLVRAMAVWALGRLDSARALELAALHAPSEADEDVRGEWLTLQKS